MLFKGLVIVTNTLLLPTLERLFIFLVSKKAKDISTILAPYSNKSNDMFNLKDYNLNETVIAWVNTLTKDNQDFDEGRFEEWLKEKNVAFKSNPSGWLKVVFPKELEKGTFNRIVYIPATTPIFNAMRERNIIVKTTDTMYIDLMLQAICSKLGRTLNKEKTEEKISEWIKGSIDYILKKIEKPSTTEFIAVFKKSKSVQALNIDWEAIDKEAKELNAKWDSTMKELEDMSNKDEELKWDEIMAILKCDSEEEMQATYKQIMKAREENDR